MKQRPYFSRRKAIFRFASALGCGGLSRDRDKSPTAGVPRQGEKRGFGAGAAQPQGDHGFFGRGHRGGGPFGGAGFHAEMNFKKVCQGKSS